MSNQSSTAIATAENKWIAEAIIGKIREIVITTFGMELADAGAPIKDAGLDSLALIDIGVSSFSVQ